MDSPSPKRRRINATESAEDDEVSKADVDNTDNDTSRRASYRAPTKASIARHNPSLISERNNIATGDIQTESATSSLRGPPRALNPTALRPKMTAPRLSASPTRETSSSPSRRARASNSLGRTRITFNGPTTNTPALTNEPANEETEAESQMQAEEERSLLEEEKLAQSVQRRLKRSRASQAGFIPSIPKDQSEPELPPTPAQLGLEERPQPPRGVLSSSPRSGAPGRKAILKSSPLKPRALPGDEAQVGEVADPQISQQAVKGTAEEGEEVEDDDPEVLERRHRFDQLSKQLQALRSEVSFLQSQVLRSQEKPTQAMSRSHLDRLVNILGTNSLLLRDESSPLKPASLATRLSSFLPFAKRPKPVPQDKMLKEEILPAYKPIEGSNPFMHLQAFTTFSVTSFQQLEPIEAEGALLNQQQLRLSAPESLNLDIDLVLLSDTDTDSVEQLSLESITPWANVELGIWIRKQAEETADIAVIGWGSSRFLNLAETRAKCWLKCTEMYPQYTSPINTPPNSRSPSSNEDRLHERDIATLIGNCSLRLESRSTQAALHISWHIGLDWIGDVESRISASAILPSRWTERDRQRRSLSKIPETFELLVGRIGVFEAIKALVRLVLDVE